MRDVNFNELIDFFCRFIDDKYAEFDSVKRTRRLAENNRYIKAFQNYISEAGFDFNDSIQQLVEGDPYKFEYFETKLNKKHIKNIFSYDFIEFCKSESINTIPLLPYYYYRDNTQSSQFQFNKDHHESFFKFKKAFLNESVDVERLALILLNIFYRFPYETLKKLKFNDIQQKLLIGPLGLHLKGYNTNIKKPLADGSDTFIPITDQATKVLLKSADKNEDGSICKISQRWINYEYSSFIRNEFGFTSTMEFKRTVMHYLVGAVGPDLANAYLGFGSRSHTKKTFESSNDVAGAVWLGEFFPLHPFYDQEFMYSKYDNPEDMREIHEKMKDKIEVNGTKYSPSLEEIFNPLQIENPSDK